MSSKQYEHKTVLMHVISFEAVPVRDNSCQTEWKKTYVNMHACVSNGYGE